MKIRAEDATNGGAVILEQPPLPIPHAHTFAELHREIRAFVDAWEIARPFVPRKLLFAPGQKRAWFE